MIQCDGFARIKPDINVHVAGIIYNGGAKPNIIPEETGMEYYIRAPTLPELKSLKKKMESCFEAAAAATGCQVKVLLVYAFNYYRLVRYVVAFSLQLAFCICYYQTPLDYLNIFELAQVID